VTVSMLAPEPERTVSSTDLSQEVDHDLMRGIVERDEDAFRSLFDRYGPTATALASRVVRRGHLAEEIVQEAFMAVWRNPQGYDPARGSVRAWLMGTVHHRAVDSVRREEAHRRRSDEAIAGLREAEVDLADGVVEAAGLPEERRQVRAAMAVLPEEQRSVLEMMYFDGLSQRRVAELTGIPLGTVKSRTLLGMRRMRAALEGVER
jgi:RNA polymerase sigma factor (sigma-70 family)